MKNLFVVLILLGALLMAARAAQSASAYSPMTKGPIQAEQKPAASPGLVTAQLAAEPQGPPTRYTNCNAIASPAYKSSITAMQWYTHNHSVDDNISEFASSSGAIHRVGTPGQAPVQPRPQPSPPSYPRTPYQRIVPKNPNVCIFGNATVRPLIGVVRSGEVVLLVVTSLVVNRGLSSFVEDTYQLPGAGSRPVSFTNIALRTIWVGFEQGTALEIMHRFEATNASGGSLVGFQTFYKGAPGSRLPCFLKTTPTTQGLSSISCPAGTKWPT